MPWCRMGKGTVGEGRKVTGTRAPERAVAEAAGRHGHRPDWTAEQLRAQPRAGHSTGTGSTLLGFGETFEVHED